ncbi:hypothetical protein DNHGIG_28360 [Collibacillus ludicampi]|uniref:Uncharacterized protein n=1 Tax=Collibacillus ludicampi TaxID=2771369 RepID=A0AAV4LHJ5_9BACL|nr:hypothetical protein [Collibacillus ludicampi]GIM47287.1 hypothetical protein DNHGIG_28360 [Collibacillus ludicampi]
MEGEINDRFEIEYLNEYQPENHFMVKINPSKYGLTIRKEAIDYTYQLKDGNKAIYSKEIVKGFKPNNPW